MRHGNQVEWALHCAATLSGLPADRRLSAAALAELYEVPPKYLAKALQAMAAAGLVASTPGPRGGYRLARPASEIRLVDIVDAVEGTGSVFRCQEIRRRGPCRRVAAAEFGQTCHLAAAMWRAEAAWRRELAAVTLAEIGDQVGRDASPLVRQALDDWVGRTAT